MRKYTNEKQNNPSCKIRTFTFVVHDDTDFAGKYHILLRILMQRPIIIISIMHYHWSSQASVQKCVFLCMRATSEKVDCHIKAQYHHLLSNGVGEKTKEYWFNLYHNSVLIVFWLNSTTLLSLASWMLYHNCCWCFSRWLCLKRYHACHISSNSRSLNYTDYRLWIQVTQQSFSVFNHSVQLKF